MHKVIAAACSAFILSCSLLLPSIASAGNSSTNYNHDYYGYSYFYKKLKHRKSTAQLGSRPFFLVDDMDPSPLKRKLQQCSKGPFYKTDFSIGHRGAPLQFPEHTKESYVAAARQGAGILECDVSFTKDGELVCRHSQCDLHTTTNIVATDLGAKCAIPFTPADPVAGTPATAKCCTSDITLAEFKTLCGKMDARDASATTAEEYLGGTAAWRTDLYATCGTLLSHKESIKLFKKLGAKFTPELKGVDPVEGFGESGLTQATYAQKLIDEYKQARVHPRKVWAQSFNPDDVRYWIQNEPRFGKQAVYLDDRYAGPNVIDPNDASTFVPSMEEIAAQGVNIIAPPMWMLVTEENDKIVPSAYAISAKAAGLDIIAWTFERSAPLANDGAWYHQTTDNIVNNDGDKYVTLDVLARQIGILGIFSDWPASVTYYANCMGL